MPIFDDDPDLISDSWKALEFKEHVRKSDIKEYQRQVKDKAEKMGYVIDPFGRKREIAAAAVAADTNLTKDEEDWFDTHQPGIIRFWKGSELTTREQRQFLEACMRDALWSFRRLLEFCAEVVGREINTFGELTSGEANMILKRKGEIAYRNTEYQGKRKDVGKVIEKIQEKVKEETSKWVDPDFAPID